MICDLDGIRREVTIAATMVPGLGRYLFATGVAREKEVTTAISDKPVIKTSAFEMELRKGAILFYLDIAINKKTDTNPVSMQVTNGMTAGAQDNIPVLSSQQSAGNI